MAAQDWQSLTKLTAGSDFVVERVRMVDSGVALEGQFELPPLARLTAEDQVFVIDPEDEAPSAASDLLTRLERGEMSVKDVLERLRPSTEE
jgi:hypothetical protein